MPCVYAVAALATAYIWLFQGFADECCGVAPARLDCSASPANEFQHAGDAVFRPAAPAWAVQLLCHRPAETCSVMSTHNRTEHGVYNIRQTATKALAFLARPALWALATGDIHHLAHVTAALLLLLLSLAAWPSSRSAAGSTTGHAAAQMAGRLLLVASVLQTLRLPAALLPCSAMGQALRHGRCRGFACLGWTQGLLLQVPLALQVVLCGIEWWSHAAIADRMDALTGASPASWQQRLVEGLLVWGLPVAAAAWGRRSHASAWLAQQQQRQQQPSAPAGPSQEPSKPSSKETKVGPLLGDITAGSSMRSSSSSSSSGAVGPCQQQRHAALRLSSWAKQGWSHAWRQLTDSSRFAPACRSAAASAVCPAAAGVPPELQLAAVAAAAVPSSQSESAPLLSQVLPAAAAAAEVTLLLPKQWCYLPVSQQLSVSIKVQHATGMPYAAAAARMAAAVTPLLCRCSSGDGLLVSSMATVPGCVLMLLDLIRPAQQQQQQEEEEESPGAPREPGQQPATLLLPSPRHQSPDAAIVGGAWQVALAPAVVPPPPSPNVQTTAVVAGAESVAAVLPLQQLGAALTSALEGPVVQQEEGQAGPSSRTIGSVTGVQNTPPALQQPKDLHLHTQPAPANCCVVGTWGQELLLQLWAPPAPTAAGGPTNDPAAAAAAAAAAAGAGAGDGRGAAPAAATSGSMAPGMRVVVVHQQRLLLDEALDAPGPTNGSSRCLGLTFTCPIPSGPTPGSTAGAPGAAPAVLSVNVLPAHAALPAATITVLMLPSEAAAELVAWVAAQQLPRQQVAAFGGDLAVMFGVLQQLSSGGLDPSLPPGTLQLGLAAASSLELFFEQSGCAAAADVVTLTKQQLLVRVMQARQAAGSVWGNMTLSTAAGDAASGSGTAAAPPPPPAAAATQQAVRVALRSVEPPAAPTAITTAGGLEPAQAHPTTHRSTAAGAGSSGAGSSSRSATTPANLGNHPKQRLPAAGPAPKLSGNPYDSAGAAGSPEGGGLTRQEVAALLAGGHAGMAVGWRGFQARAFEQRYQEFRAKYLLGWDRLCRGYSLLQCVLLTRGKLLQLQAAGLSAWGVVPTLLLTVLGITHVVLLWLAPALWERRRDLVLCCFMSLCQLVWAAESAWWPTPVLHGVYGSGGRLLLFSFVEFLMSLPGPRAALGAARVVTPCGLLVLAMAADQEAAAQGGINAWLLHAKEHRRHHIGWAAGVYGATHLLLVLLLVSGVELMLRRAFLRHVHPRCLPAS